MKVLMIAPQPFLEPRGTPISVYQRLRSLSALGHEIDLLTYHVGQDIDMPGVKIHRNPRIPFIKGVKPGPSWRKLFLDILLFFKAILMLLTRRYDVIHTHEEAAYFSIVLAALFRTRHLYDMHSSLPQQLGNFGFLSHRPVVKLFEFLERSTIKTCDAVITISSDLKDRVIETKPTAKQLMIENLALQIVFPDTRKLTVSALKAKLGINGKLPIVYTGNFERYQGVELLFESAEIVKKHHSEILFVFVGGKPQEVERWRNEVRRKKLDDYALFVGSVSLEESLTYLDMAEILVSPRTGGTSVPLKIYTYLVSGKAMVATNLISHTQVLNEDIAVLVQPTKEAMADGIVRLIRDPNLRLQLGLNAREFAHQKYNQDNYVAKLEQIYQALQVPECAPKQRVTSLNGH